MTRLASFVQRHASLVVLIWLAVAAFLTVTAPSVSELGTADRTAFLPASAPSGQADALLRRAFPDDPTRDAALIVLSRPGGLLPADHQYASSLTGFLRSPAAQTQVRAVQSAADNPELAPLLRSADGAAELVVVSLRTQIFTVSSQKAINYLRDHLAATAPAGLQKHVTGLAALTADQATATLQAFNRTAVATVALVLLILVLVYRSALAPLISLLTIGTSFLVARGIAGYLAQAGLGVASLAETFMIVMAFGAGTDYAMFVLSRHREASPGEAGRTAYGNRIAAATAAVSPTVIASGATVTLAFMSFLAAKLGLLRSFGPVLGIAVAVTVLASLTLTPAFMRLAGSALYWPRRSAHLDAQRGHRRWSGLAALVARRPLPVLLASLTALAVPAAAAAHTSTTFDVTSELPANSDARQGFELLARHFPAGEVAPTLIVVSADASFLDGDRLSAVDRLTDRLRALPGVAQVRSITQPAGAPLTRTNLSQLTGGRTDLRTLGIDPNHVDVGPLLAGLSKPGGLRLTGDMLRRYPAVVDRLGYFLGADRRTTRLVVEFDSSPYTPRVLTAVGHMDRDAANALAGGGLAGAKVAVTGPSAFSNDVQHLATGDLRTVGSLALATILLVLAGLVRSVVAPLYLLASVIVSMLAAMGLSTLVFQDLFGEGIGFYLPILLFVILVALGSDYNIFIIGRIREDLDAGMDVREATVNSLITTGPTITAAGFVLAGTFAALLLTPLPTIRQIGFGVAAGIFIDTFLVRTMLVPAATILLGRRAFWPSTGTVSPSRRRPLVVGAAVGVVALAAAIPGAAFATRDQLGVRRVPASASATTTVAAPAPASTAVVGKAAAQATPSTVRRLAPRPSPKVPGKKPSANPARVPGTDHSRPIASAKPQIPVEAPELAAPVEGRWTYHVEGTRTVGAAGSAQPFSEDSDTNVTRDGGSPTAPEFRVSASTSFATSEERRRYDRDSIQSLGMTVNALGLSYGGNYDSPQRLLQLPFRAGDEWSSTWHAAGTTGTTTTTAVGTRQVTVAGASKQCYEITRTTQLRGEITGTQVQHTCWIPELGMAASDQQQLQGTYRGIPVQADIRMTLLSPPVQAGNPRQSTSPYSASAVQLSDRPATPAGPTIRRHNVDPRSRIGKRPGATFFGGRRAGSGSSIGSGPTAGV